MLASDLAAELARDPEHRRRQTAREVEEEHELRRLAKAEIPLLDDLAAIGVRTDSAWNLDRVPGSRPKAIPVLLEHLGREYHDKVLEGIANARATA